MSAGGRPDKAALDPRLNAIRPDLAAAPLRGRVQAPRFAEGMRKQVAAPAAQLRRAPRFDAPQDTEALLGETAIVYDETEGWAWCQLERDGYVGYLPADALADQVIEPTHTVSALRTYVFPAPDIKAPPLALVSLGARLAVAATEGSFLRLASGGFVCAVHARPAVWAADDFVAVAERFVGTPYLWGGRTSLGVDCSGLVQLSLQAAGQACPRDTDMQEAAVGTALPEAGGAALRRGDLVFWEGHVGIMVDGTRLLHANAHHMEATVEPLEEVASRNPKPIRSVRRP